VESEQKAVADARGHSASYENAVHAPRVNVGVHAETFRRYLHTASVPVRSSRGGA